MQEHHTLGWTSLRPCCGFGIVFLYGFWANLGVSVISCLGLKSRGPLQSKEGVYPPTSGTLGGALPSCSRGPCGPSIWALPLPPHLADSRALLGPGSVCDRLQEAVCLGMRGLKQGKGPA